MTDEQEMEIKDTAVAIGTFEQKLQAFMEKVYANVRTALIAQAGWKEEDERLIFAQTWTWEKMNPQSLVQPFKKGKMKTWTSVMAKAYTADGKVIDISVSFH